VPAKDYCRPDPSTVAPEEPIRDAAQRMQAHGVGSLVVVDEDGCPIGMLTDRDIVLSTVRRHLDAESTPVREVMHAPVVTVTGGAPLGVAIRFMRQHSLRRIPVVDHRTGRLEGILASDDVVQILSDELSGAAELMRSQFPTGLAGAPARDPGAEAG
jgi:CBS domain-containing protein